MSIPVETVGHGERILVVDDEIFIVTFARISLNQLGYNVETETNVLEALARLEREPQAFQLVITDYTMPELTGLEFARRIRALRCDMPVIISTGHVRKLTPERLHEAGICEVLEKPYSVEKLAATVRRGLAANQPI